MRRHACRHFALNEEQQPQYRRVHVKAVGSTAALNIQNNLLLPRLKQHLAKDGLIQAEEALRWQQGYPSMRNEAHHCKRRMGVGGGETVKREDDTVAVSTEALSPTEAVISSLAAALSSPELLRYLTPDELVRW